MTNLSQRDLHAAFSLLELAAEQTGRAPFSATFLEELRRLTGAGVVNYGDLDRRRRTEIHSESSAYVDARATKGRFDPVYWEVAHSCPTRNYQDRTGRSDTKRFSDLVSRRAYHELPIYREYFLPDGLDAAMVCLFRPVGGRDRNIIFFRERGEKDFSERDRDLVELMRPQLARLLELAELKAQRDHQERTPELTAREQEIVDLVAEGKTNAEIARLLWIAPSTVKKHLENVYAKLEVPSRAAAAARARSGAR